MKLLPEIVISIILYASYATGFTLLLSCILPLGDAFIIACVLAIFASMLAFIKMHLEDIIKNQKFGCGNSCSCKKEKKILLGE